MKNGVLLLALVFLGCSAAIREQGGPIFAPGYRVAGANEDSSPALHLQSIDGVVASSSESRDEAFPAASANTTSMVLEPLDSRHARTAISQNARVFSDGQFNLTVQRYRDYDCPGDRPLCAR